jgi:hypothetical protein
MISLLQEKLPPQYFSCSTKVPLLDHVLRRVTNPRPYGTRRGPSPDLPLSENGKSSCMSPQLSILTAVSHMLETGEPQTCGEAVASRHITTSGCEASDTAEDFDVDLTLFVTKGAAKGSVHTT